MLIKEFRVVLPLEVAEYHVGQLYCVAKFSKENTGGGEGVEVLKNEPYKGEPLLGNEFTEGQYTHKVYHLENKVPWWIRKLAPKGSLEMHEKAWNAYPYCRTIITNPDYMKGDFYIKVETLHLPDRGTTENAHRLSPDLLGKREVVMMDIANDPISPSDYKESEDPKLFKSKKTGRGPLSSPNWQSTVTPVMTCYKLVTVEFRWLGLQTKMENFIMKAEKRLFNTFHRQVFCTLDSWYGLTIADIRVIEEEAKAELEKQIRDNQKRGMVEN